MSGRRLAAVGGDGSGAKRLPSQPADPRSNTGSAEGIDVTEVLLRVGISGPETAVGISAVWRKAGLALASPDEGSIPAAGAPTGEWGREWEDGECTRFRTAGRSSPLFGVALMASAGV